MANRCLARPQHCLTCAHPARAQIELLLASGVKLPPIGRKFGLGVHALRRHWRNHMSAAARAALAMGPTEQIELLDRIADESSSVIDHLRAIRCGLYRAYSSSLEAGDANGSALLAGRLHENLSLMAKVTGELTRSPLIQNNQLTLVMNSPQMQSFLADLAKQLRPHPDALRAVLDAVNNNRPALEHNPS